MLGLRSGAAARLMAGLLALGAAAAMLVGPAVSAQASVVCPTVDPMTGAVNPPPSDGVNWSGCDLAGADLASAPLSNARLDGANLSSANLKTADLVGASLSRADLTKANLTGAVVTGAILDVAVLTGSTVGGAAFAGSDMIEIVSGGLKGTPASLPVQWNLVRGFLVGGSANLTGANFSGLDLTRDHLNSTNLTGADLAHADLSGNDLEGCKLIGANLTDANLTNARVGGSALASAVLAGTNLTGASLTLVSSGGITGQPAHLPVNWILRAGYLIGPGDNLRNASLAGVNLAGADLFFAQMQGAILSGTDLAGANLAGANLAGANLAGADLAGANLTRFATLTKANLSGANLSNADLAKAFIDVADLHRATLNGADLALANLTGSDLTASSLVGANLTKATFAGLEQHSFVSAQLAGANLTRANLSGIVWMHAALAGVTFVNANFTGAQLEFASFDHAGGGATDYANLDGANFTGADLSGADLAAANPNLSGVRWLNTICPDGSNSNAHIGGCFGPLDTTPPVVTVTGVRSGKQYVLGGVPKAGCKTTDDGTVAVPAKLTITTTGSHRAGKFTATCAGAVDLAGNQAAPVGVHYTVVYGFGGYLSPLGGSRIRRSAGHVTVTFRLVRVSGAPIAASVAAALAAAHRVRVTLSGPGITAVQVNCGWASVRGVFRCVVPIPARVRTGTASYKLIATENPWLGTFVTAPAAGGARNPEFIHFS